MIDGSLLPEFLSGGTFTVSNIGSFGIETFTPVINLPQTAILGVGAITPRPVVAAAARSAWSSASTCR